MEADDAIALVLQLDLYQPDLETGTLVGPSGRSLACPPDREGYRTVTLCLPDGGRRNVRLHRLVAAAGWGIEAIRGRQVGHKDGDTAHNWLGNLWLPATQAEHYAHDDAVSPKYKGGVAARTTWPPCVRCGEPDGPVRGRAVTPSRTSGAAFGIDGDLCWRCYRALHERERRRRKRESADASSTLGATSGVGDQDHRNEVLEH